MKKLDVILCIIEAVLMIACLVLEFVPVTPWIRITVVTVAAVYNLACLIWFEARKYIKNKKED